MGKFTVIVLDSVGVGELPDAADFGDVGTNTLRHVDEFRGGLNIPNMKSLGLFNIDGTGLTGVDEPEGCYGKAVEQAKAKAEAPLRKRIAEAMGRVGIARGLAFIINTDQQAVAWTHPMMGEDVTEAVKTALR